MVLLFDPTDVVVVPILIVYLIIVNVVSFVMYGIDKKRSLNGKTNNRISEQTLLNCAHLGGGIGCWMAMWLFHHKTKKKPFKSEVPLWIVIWFVLILIIIIV